MNFLLWVLFMLREEIFRFIVWMNMFVGLCLCVSVYDRYHVFMGLRNWYPCVSFFFNYKVTHVFL